MTNQDPTQIQGGRQTPPNIARYGYAALFLFSIVGAITGAISGLKIATAIVLACVVVGFMLSLFAFDRIARSDDRAWRIIGVFLCTFALVVIVAVFTSVLSYFLTGHPTFLGSLFAGAVQPDSNTTFSELKSALSEDDFYRMTVDGCFIFEYDHSDLVRLPEPVIQGILNRHIGDVGGYKQEIKEASSVGEKPDEIHVMAFVDYNASREYDLAIGARQAQAAKDYLVSLGYPADHIDTISYGREKGTTSFGPYFCGAIVCRENRGGCGIPSEFTRHLLQYGQ